MKLSKHSIARSLQIIALGTLLLFSNVAILCPAAADHSHASFYSVSTPEYFECDDGTSLEPCLKEGSSLSVGFDATVDSTDQQYDHMGIKLYWGYPNDRQSKYRYPCSSHQYSYGDLKNNLRDYGPLQTSTPDKEIIIDQEKWEQHKISEGLYSSIELENWGWTFTEGEDFDAEPYKEGESNLSFFLRLRITAYDENNDEIYHNDYDMRRLNLHVENSNPLTNSIEIFCGNYRYGAPSDRGFVDYPYAYPIVAQVKNSSGALLDGEGVIFSVSGPATIPGWGSICAVQTGNVEVGGSRAPGTVTVNGAAKCPIEFMNEGDVTVRASLEDDPSELVSFELKGTYDIDIPAGNDPNPNNMHEIFITCIQGDGLWGECYSPPYDDDIKVDNDESIKNLRLEIDYMEGLVDGNVNLKPLDMTYIFGKVYDILEQVGIQLDPEVHLNPDDKYEQNPIDERQTGSVLQSMTWEDSWDDDGNSTLRDIIGDHERVYSVQQLEDILAKTRGVFGTELTYAGHNLSMWERVRLHIVLLPGRHYIYEQGERQNAPGRCVCMVGSNAPYYSSGPQEVSVPWTDGSAECEERTVDAMGICISTGVLPPISWVNDAWKTPDPYNPYCDILANIIAHEIGHAIGLNDEDVGNEDQVMFKDRNFSNYEYSQMTRISDRNKTEDYYINLRKVVDRETIDLSW